MLSMRLEEEEWEEDEDGKSMKRNGRAMGKKKGKRKSKKL
jgi:hypothetical protein